MGSGLSSAIPKTLQFSSNFINFIAVVHERKKPNGLTLARDGSPWREPPIAPERRKIQRHQNAITFDRNTAIGLKLRNPNRQLTCLIVVQCYAHLRPG